MKFYIGLLLLWCLSVGAFSDYRIVNSTDEPLSVMGSDGKVIYHDVPSKTTLFVADLPEKGVVITLKKSKKKFTLKTSVHDKTLSFVLNGKSDSLPALTPADPLQRKMFKISGGSTATRYVRVEAHLVPPDNKIKPFFIVGDIMLKVY